MDDELEVFEVVRVLLDSLRDRGLTSFAGGDPLWYDHAFHCSIVPKPSLWEIV